MKRITIAVLSALLFISTASAQLIKSKEPIEAKYLTGAVPIVNGMVTFERSFNLPEKTDPQKIYDEAKHWIGKYFARQEVIMRKSLDHDSVNCFIKVGINEYITFKNHALALDRSQMIYSLAIKVDKTKYTVTMSDITYYYEEERSPEKYTAEEWITDEYALKKNKQAFVKGHGKFRRLTIDTFDGICDKLSNHLQSKK